MKRIFIGIKIEAGENLLGMISSFRTGLRDGNIKWTEVENLHITLAFLGDTEEAKIKAIISMLKGTCEGSGEFELVIRGAGVFKNFSDPRIIWTGIDASEKLIQLNSAIKNGLRDTGISIEDRLFNPHLTLGRIKNINDNVALKSLMNEYQATEFQRTEVNEVVLYESILLHSGPVYKPISKFKLVQIISK